MYCTRHFLFIPIVLGLSAQISAQQGATQQPPAPNLGGTPPAGQAGPTGPTAAAATAKNPGVEDDDPNAVSVIIGAVKAPDRKALATAVAGLGDEKTFTDSFNKLVAALHDDAVTAAAAQSAAGKQGPHILLHILQIDDKNYDKTSAVRTTSTWYVWRKGINFEEFTGTRLYGIQRLHVLTIIGPFKVDNAMAVYQNIEYRALVKKKLAANVQNLLSLLKIVGFAAQSALDNEYLYGFGSLKKVAVISDITVGGYFRDDKDPTKLHPVGSKVLLDNEGYHWWDVSIGFPVKRVEELEYVQTGNSIQSKQVDKSAIYAFGDIYLRSVDIKNPGNRFSPAIVLGTGLKGKVRDNLFAGVTTNFGPIPGLSWTKSSWWQLFRPFAGIQFINVSRPASNPAPGATTNQERTIHKLSVGLNIPIASTLDKLLSKDPATPAVDPVAKKATPAANK